MTQTTVRPAQTEDKDTILAFCTHTWDWGDYIDRVWDDWFVDPQGELFVAVTDGQPTGVAHLRMINATDAWLEGLRVDPNYRHQGIATALNMAILEEAIRRGATNARPCHRVYEHGVYSHYGHDSDATSRSVCFISSQTICDSEQQAVQRVDYSPERTQLATPDDLNEIIDYLNASNVFPAVGGLYYVGFVAYEITAAWLEKQIAAQHIYLLRRWERLDGLAIAEPREDLAGKRLSIGYIDGMTIEAISLVAYDLRHRLTEMGLENAFVYAPDLMLIRDGLTGIEYEWNGTVFYTYERGLV